MKSSLIGLAAAITLSASAASAQSAQSFRSEYAVSLYGLVLARSSFTSTISSDGFDVSGQVSSAGIASVFDDTKGTTKTSGRFARDAVRPQAFSVNYTSGSKKKSTTITFAGDRVARAVNTPPVNTKRADWIALQDGHLTGVADPLSATLVKASSPGEVCGRTIALFDGAMRANLHLAPAGSGKVSVPGYAGNTVTCSARFEPVSGYRRNNSSIRYLRESSGITIQFAPVGDTGIYAPIEAAVGTKIGTIRVAARRFEAVN